jgi:hypothetical protein
MARIRLFDDVRRSTARFDPTRRYRYTLLRVWDHMLPRLCCCMLNPSTADIDQDDPTVARCGRFARAWGFGSLEVVNIFALRATDPRRLYDAPDPIGPANDAAILAAARRADLFLAAWGNHGALLDRGRRILHRLLERDVAPHCLAITKQGQPKHPLYTKSNSLPLPLPSSALSAPLR